MNAELKKSMKVAGDEARYDAYAKRLLSEKIVLAHILVKVVDEFRGMKPQEVVRYIEGDVRIGDVPVDPGLTNASVEVQENAVIIGLSDELPEHNETYDLHRFLGVLLSNNLDYYEKVEIMEKEYELELPEEWKEGTETMYSFAAEIRKKGEARGEERMGKLSELLVSMDRTKDIIKAVQDITYRQKLYKEFGL